MVRSFRWNERRSGSACLNGLAVWISRLPLVDHAAARSGGSEDAWSGVLAKAECGRTPLLNCKVSADASAGFGKPLQQSLPRSDRWPSAHSRTDGRTPARSGVSRVPRGKQSAKMMRSAAGFHSDHAGWKLRWIVDQCLTSQRPAQGRGAALMAVPYWIHMVLTDNGTHLTDPPVRAGRPSAGSRHTTPSVKHR
jgi:hypothetical protein